MIFLVAFSYYEPKKFQVYGLGIFLSKPQAWYIIRRKSVYHQRRLSAFASHHASACIFLRLDDIQHYVLMICNSFGIDDIHALRRDFMASCVDALDFQGLFVFQGLPPFSSLQLFSSLRDLNPRHFRTFEDQPLF
jgi:hypothetical protein